MSDPLTDPVRDPDLEPQAVDGWAEQWRRTSLWPGRGPQALGIDAEGVAVPSQTGDGVRRASWRSVRSIAARKTILPGGSRRRPRARWYMDLALEDADRTETLSIEVTGLDAAWPQILHTCRTAWAAAQTRERPKPKRLRRPSFSWAEAGIIVRRG